MSKVHSTWNFPFDVSFIPGSTDFDVGIFGGGQGMVVALFHPAPSRPPHGSSCWLQFLLSCQAAGKRKWGRMKKHTYQPSQFPHKSLPTSPWPELTHVATSPLEGDWKMCIFFFFLVRKCLTRMKILFLWTKKGWLLGGQPAF